MRRTKIFCTVQYMQSTVQFFGWFCIETHFPDVIFINQCALYSVKKAGADSNGYGVSAVPV